MGNCIDTTSNKVQDKKAIVKRKKETPPPRESKISNSNVPSYPSIEDILRQRKIRKYNTALQNRS